MSGIGLSKIGRILVILAGLMGADHIARLTSRIVGAEVSAVVDADASRAKKAVEAIPMAVALSNVGQALDREDVNEIAVVAVGPYMVACRSLDELGRDANLIASLAHRAFNYIGRA